MLGVALASLLIQALVVCIKLLAHHQIGSLEHGKAFLSNLTNNTNRKTRAGERLTVHHLIRQAKCRAQCTNLILEEVIQRLDQIKMHTLGERNEVVMALDGLARNVQALDAVFQ